MFNPIIYDLWLHDGNSNNNNNTKLLHISSYYQSIFVRKIYVLLIRSTSNKNKQIIFSAVSFNQLSSHFYVLS